MIGRALDSGATAAWVAADEVYGHDSKLRRFLEGDRCPTCWPWLLTSACGNRFHAASSRRDTLSLPASRWKRLSAGFGSKGERLYDWALMQLSKQDGWTRALLVRRSIEEKPECAYYLCYAPPGKDTIETLVRVAGQRWLIEQSFETAKGECGLITTRCATGTVGTGILRCPCWPMQCYPYCERVEKKTSRRASAAQRTRTAPLLTGMLWRGWHGIEHLLHWSQWRRRHQFRPCTATIESADRLCPHSIYNCSTRPQRTGPSATNQLSCCTNAEHGERAVCSSGSPCRHWSPSPWNFFGVKEIQRPAPVLVAARDHNFNGVTDAAIGFDSCIGR